MSREKQFDERFKLDLTLFKDGNYYQYKTIPITPQINKIVYFYLQRVNREQRSMGTPDYLYLAFESCGGHFIGMSEDLEEIKIIMLDHADRSARINTPPEGWPLD